LQPGEHFVQPRNGFRVSSVHSINDFDIEDSLERGGGFALGLRMFPKS